MVLQERAVAGRFVNKFVAVALVIVLMGGGAFGVFMADGGLSQVSHNEQGANCGGPSSLPACSALVSQEQLLRGLQALAVVAFVAGIVVLLVLLLRASRPSK